jgi:phosphoribosyl-ATP pyrophosphohydrolase/phosphoribosyl-AMP cyclohydrolase
MTLSSFDLDALDFTKGVGLITVVVQDSSSGVVLMVAHADREAMERTLTTGQMHFRSRTRGLWHKGATSGSIQRVVSLTVDCDRDAVLARVTTAGPACHTGAQSCFGEDAVTPTPLSTLDRVIAERALQLEGKHETTQLRSYTQRLLTDRNLRLKKLGEEVAELVIACADEDRERAIEEAADVIYHTLVALRAVGAGLNEVASALTKRNR